MKIISYSDVSSCVKGCNEMRKLQKNQIQQSNKVPKIIAQKSLDEVAHTDADNIKTFVVVRNNDLGVSSDDFYISMVRLMDSLFSEVEPLDSSSRPGYRGDREQLTLPRLSQPQRQR